MKTLVFILILAPAAICTLNALLNRFSRIHIHKTPFLAGTYVLLLWIPAFIYECIRLNGFSLTEFIFDFLYVSCFVFSLIFLNWFVFTLTDVSMHIQILMQIYRHPGITRNKLLQNYNKSIILKNRIPRLLELGQLKLRKERLFISGRSVLFGAWVCLILRYILGLPLHPEDARHET